MCGDEGRLQFLYNMGHVKDLIHLFLTCVYICVNLL